MQRIRQQESRRRRRRQLLVGAGTLVVAGGIAGAIVATTGSGAAAGRPSASNLAALSTLGTLQPAPAPGATGPEGVPVPSATVLAGTATKATGQPVDGVGCSTTEQTLFHIHAHLTVFVNLAARQIPYGIGIPGASPAACDHWCRATGGKAVPAGAVILATRLRAAIT